MTKRTKKNRRILLPFIVFLIATLSSAEVFSGKRNDLPENARVDLDGTLAVAIRENLETGDSKLEFLLERGVDAAPIELLFSEGPPKGLRSGIGLQVRGVVRNGRINVEAAQSTDSTDQTASRDEGLIAPAFTLEEPTVAVIIVNPSDASHSETEISKMAGYYFGETHSMRDMYKEISFGQLVMNADADANGSPDVFGPVQVSATSAQLCSTPFNYTSEAEQSVPGFNASRYDHRIYAVPKDMNCGWTGIAYISCGSSCRAFNRWSFDVNTTSHEFGHNWGLSHAGVGSNEYSDYSSFMGYSISNRVRALDGAHHWLMGWYEALDPFSVETVTSSGTYTLAPIGNDPAFETAPTLIRVMVASGEPYFLSTRQAAGYDTDLLSLSPESLEGISIHRMNDGAYDNSERVAILAADDTFWDAENNLSITQLGGKGADGYLMVDISLTQVDSCTHASPTVSVTPSTARVGSNGSQVFAVNVINSDSSGCNAESFDVRNSDGWLKTLLLAAGQQGQASFTLQGGSSDSTLSTTVTVTATDHTDHVVSALATLVVDTTGPEAPANLSASYQKKGRNHRVSLGWTASASSDTAGYEIRRDGTVIGTTAQTNFTDTLESAPAGPIMYSVVPSDDLGNVGIAAEATIDSGGDDGGTGGSGKCHPKKGC